MWAVRLILFSYQYNNYYSVDVYAQVIFIQENGSCMDEDIELPSPVEPNSSSDRKQKLCINQLEVSLFFKLLEQKLCMFYIEW